MGASEFAYWKAFFNMHQWGPKQDDQRAGFQTSILYNSNKKKSSPACGPEFFFPSLGPPKPTAEEEEDRLKRMCERIAGAYGDE